jgi:hypothetical protein
MAKVSLLTSGTVVPFAIHHQSIEMLVRGFHPLRNPLSASLLLFKFFSLD